MYICTYIHLLTLLQLWNDALTLVKTFQLLPCIDKEWKIQLKQIIQDRVNNKQVIVKVNMKIF